MVHHMRQTWDKYFIVRAKQALWTQYRKTCLRIGLRQQINHLFAGGFTAGELIGKPMRAEIFFDITVMVVIKIERGEEI